ncbi:hypothetical protein [Enterococcus gallinarum]|uniref:hypothetical protein n=1 Tax=Enterococcus gallinarum TaxID=1353 RepID=UPI001D17A480|nr:hypothetical protein [Enterococcus gallinarum]MCC4043763.1 hypothetical protein [Enterococcus gallinarum]
MIEISASNPNKQHIKTDQLGGFIEVQVIDTLKVIFLKINDNKFEQFASKEIRFDFIGDIYNDGTVTIRLIE